MVGRALDLDEQHGLAVREAERRLPLLDRGHRARVQQLRGRRQHARREEVVERAHRVLEPLVASKDDRACRWPRLHAQAKRRDDAKRSLRSDEQLREVDAARALERLRTRAARPDDRSVGEDDLAPEHVRRCRSPPHGVRAARVVRGHPAERACAAAAGIGWEEEAVWRERGLEVVEHEAGAHDRLQIRAVDLDHLAHARERDDDPALCGDRAACLPRARAARDDRRVRLIREADHALHVFGRARHDDDIR